jgi:hypothetical protein
MRTLMRVQVETEAGNRAIKDGTLPKVIQSTLERLKPEGAFFTTLDGARTAYFVFDMAEPSQIPAIAEPFFMELNAKVDFYPAMNVDDVQKGLQNLPPMS